MKQIPWERTHDGTLCMVWRENTRPVPAMTEVYALYHQAFLPNLRRDLTRLHEALIASTRTERPVSLYDYVGDFATFKTGIGALSLPDTNALDTESLREHDRVTAGQTLRAYDQLATLRKRWAERALPADHPDYIAGRHVATAYDTGDALRRIAARFHDLQSLRTLYAATVSGGHEAALKLLTGPWALEGARDDMDRLGQRMFMVRAEHAMRDRARLIAAAPPVHIPASSEAQVRKVYEIRAGIRGMVAA